MTGLLIKESIEINGGETLYTPIIIYLANFAELTSAAVILINIL